MMFTTVYRRVFLAFSALIFAIGFAASAQSEGEFTEWIKQVKELSASKRFSEAATYQEKVAASLLRRLDLRNEESRRLVWENYLLLISLYKQCDETRKEAETWESVYRFLRPYTKWGGAIADARRKAASAYTKAGKFQQAEALLREELQDYEKAWGQDHPAVCWPLVELALFYIETTNFEEANMQLERGLEICRKFTKRTSDDGLEANQALTQMVMATLKVNRRDFQGAYAMAKPAWKYFGSHRDKFQMEFAVNVRTMAVLALKNNDLTAAEGYYRQSAKELQTANNGKGILVALAYYGLGVVHEHLRNDEQAAKDYRKALKLFEDDKATQESFPFLISGRIAWVLFRTAHSAVDRQQALDVAIKARKTFLNALAAHLDYGSEQLRLGFQKEANEHISSLVGLLAEFGETKMLVSFVLAYKAAIFDSICEDHALAARADDQKSGEIVQQLTKNKAQLFALSPSERESERGHTLRAQRDSLEQRLTNLGLLDRSARSAMSVTPEQITSALSTESALVDFVSYAQQKTGNVLERRYGAVIYQPNTPPEWIPLNEMRDADFRKALVTFTSEMEAAPAHQADAGRLLAALMELRQRVWDPIEAKLRKDISSVIVCPDGDIYRVPFAALMTANGAFLAEHRSFAFVDSPRHILASKQSFPATKSAIFAYPDFSSTPNQKSPTTPSSNTFQTDAYGRSKLAFSTLADQPFNETGYTNALGGEAFLGERATEQNLYSLRSPRILHLQTHGFYITSSPSKPVATEIEDEAITALLGAKGRASENPLQQSGVALAGAAVTVNAWREASRNENNRSLPDPLTDGILTAEEASTLHLSGTQLVTIASCESGQGVPQIGEGVLGLRRGFLMSGARQIITAGWRVGANFSADFFLRFYRSQPFDSDKSPLTESFPRFQAAELKRLKDNEGRFVDAVFNAGAFTITFRR